MALSVGIIVGGGIASQQICVKRAGDACFAPVADISEAVARRRADEPGCEWTPDYRERLAHAIDAPYRSATDKTSVVLDGG